MVIFWCHFLLSSFEHDFFVEDNTAADWKQSVSKPSDGQTVKSEWGNTVWNSKVNSVSQCSIVVPLELFLTYFCPIKSYRILLWLSWRNDHEKLYTLIRFDFVTKNKKGLYFDCNKTEKYSFFGWGICLIFVRKKNRTHGIEKWKISEFKHHPNIP